MKFDYISKKRSYSEEKVFDTLNIDINVGITHNDRDVIYAINDIEVSDNDYVSRVLRDIGKRVSQTVGQLDVKHPHSELRSSWSAFYAIKEIVDIIQQQVDRDYCLYFRGQTGNWALQPTLYREGISGYSDDFRAQYDKIYESIANKFPHEIKYVPDYASEERAANLAILQHYGLGTPLVDITENPFIAMLFMTNNYKYVKANGSPKFDVFFVRADGDNSLFQTVKEMDHNLRITVQKGAFLNFEKLDDDLVYGKKKLDRISINIKYDDNQFKDDVFPDGGDEHADSNAEIALTTAMKDIESKLKTFHYVSSDLFPDFYKFLEMVKFKYSDEDSKESPWYRFGDTENNNTNEE